MNKNPTKKYFRPTKNFDHFFLRQNFSDVFFDEQFSTNIFSDHLFRSQMIQRFRKSHLEQRTAIIKNTNSAHEKQTNFFCSIYRLAALKFVNLLYSSVFLPTSPLLLSKPSLHLTPVDRSFLELARLLFPPPPECFPGSPVGFSNFGSTRGY